MKRVRLAGWSGRPLLAAAARPSRPSPAHAAASPLARTSTRCGAAPIQPWASLSQSRSNWSAAALTEKSSVYEDDASAPSPLQNFPSPPPDRALSSAKLAALRARLSLPEKIPLQTLARTLVDPSADPDPRFNNSNLAFLGSTLLGYHVTEHLACHYPRLPFTVLTEALRAFAGPKALYQVARSWGVEHVAAPGGEVDPGLLQFSVTKDRPFVRRWGVERPEAKFLEKYKWRRGINSRVVHDDQFGDLVQPSPENIQMLEAESVEEETHDWVDPNQGESGLEQWRPGRDKLGISHAAHADMVRAVVGAMYAHCGRDMAHGLIKAHVLSRKLNLASLFGFHIPTRELSRLCAREGFEPPVARLLSETGRMSRTPVFVVGIYSGPDKLGEGAGASPNEARTTAAMNALKAWYLYSPGPQTRVPSDMLIPGAAPWEPAYVDIGEII